MHSQNDSEQYCHKSSPSTPTRVIEACPTSAHVFDDQDSHKSVDLGVSNTVAQKIWSPVTKIFERLHGQISIMPHSRWRLWHTVTDLLSTKVAPADAATPARRCGLRCSWH